MNESLLSKWSSVSYNQLYSICLFTDRSLESEKESPLIIPLLSNQVVIEPKHRFINVPYNQSFLFGHSHCIADMSCFNGDRSRVGWSNGRIMSVIHSPNQSDHYKAADLSSSLSQAITTGIAVENVGREISIKVCQSTVTDSFGVSF